MPKEEEKALTFKKPALKTLISYAANYPTLGKVLLPEFYASAKSAKILKEVLNEPQKYFSSAGWKYFESNNMDNRTYISISWRYFDVELSYLTSKKVSIKKREEVLLKLFIESIAKRMIAKGRDKLAISPDW